MDDEDHENCEVDLDDLDDDDDTNDEFVTVLPVPDALEGKSSFRWSGKTPTRTTRTPQRNIINIVPGNKPIAQNIVNEVELWDFFFPPHIIDHIVLCTNKKIEEETIKAMAEEKREVTYRHETTAMELRALFELYYISGELQQNRMHSRDLFNLRFGTPYCRAVMSEQRFVFLTSCLRFDEIEEREEKRKTDRLAPMRYVFDHIIQTSKDLYTPSDTVTLDEQLLGFHGRCGFKVFIKSKPDKYGLKLLMLNDSRSWYMINAEVYTGKADTTSEIPLAQKYLLDLSAPFKIKITLWYVITGSRAFRQPSNFYRKKLP